MKTYVDIISGRLTCGIFHGIDEKVRIKYWKKMLEVGDYLGVSIQQTGIIRSINHLYLSLVN